MNWAEKTKELRMKLLLTQTEFAQMIGIAFTTENRYENGHCEPTMKIKRKLMKMFIEYGIVKD